MTFPVYIPLGSLRIHPHPLFEVLAYAVGYQLYRWQRRTRGDFLPSSTRLWIVTAAICGAAIGSKLLTWLEDPSATLHHWNDPAYLLGGKTIVGGLLGGTIAVEWIKRRMGITRRTGDLFAIPLCVGTAIGRVGCFLTGLADDTYGVATSLPWGIDFGDGVRRHPTQLYESAFVLLLALWLGYRGRRPHREGGIYRGFLFFYLSFRFCVEFVKPGITIAGITGIQWACLAGIIWYWRDVLYLFAPGGAPPWAIASGPTSTTTPPLPSAPPVTAEPTEKSSSRTTESTW
jgi:prolipoprotein diacylglyceryltransferase